MCITFLFFQGHHKVDGSSSIPKERYRCILINNRDEEKSRPTKKTEKYGSIISSVDGQCQTKGSWMGISTEGRFSVLTNYREPNHEIDPDAPSRGGLVWDFLAGEEEPVSYMKQIKQRAEKYNGFNLCVGDWNKGDDILYFSNRDNVELQRIKSSEVHGLCNKTMDVPWPKVERGKKLFDDVISKEIESEEALIVELLQVLKDRTRYPEDQLPNTGVSLQREVELSSIFVDDGRGYGTRTHTIWLIDGKGQLMFYQEDWDPDVDDWVKITMKEKIEINGE
eukprot:Nk52_evm44s2367 gene=Nk52_evmTU44s2367